MTTATASYPRKISIAPDSTGTPGVYADVGGQTKTDFDDMLESVDVTQINSSGVKARLQTLFDSQATCEFLYDSADTAQGTIRSGKSGRVQVWAKFYLTATTGAVVPLLVKSIKTSMDPAGVLKQTVTFEGSGGAALTTF